MEFYAKNREEWHHWLKVNHRNVTGVWLIYYKKSSGKPRVAYEDAVEEALCFGWIDGKIKRVNDDYYMQWFTPRRPRSKWSKLNIERAQKLIADKMMQPAGLEAFEAVNKNPDLVYGMKRQEDELIPEDLMKALTEKSTALANFMNFTSSSRRLYVLWLNSAKRKETRVARINRIVDNSEKNIKAGMM